MISFRFNSKTGIDHLHLKIKRKDFSAGDVTGTGTGTGIRGNYRVCTDVSVHVPSLKCRNIQTSVPSCRTILYIPLNMLLNNIFLRLGPIFAPSALLSLVDAVYCCPLTILPFDGIFSSDD